jgi:hypothetical protein
LLGALRQRQARELEPDATANLKKLLHTSYPLATDKKHDFPKRWIGGDSVKWKNRLDQRIKLDHQLYPIKLTDCREKISQSSNPDFTQTQPDQRNRPGFDPSKLIATNDGGL